MKISFLLMSDKWAGTENAVYNLAKELSQMQNVHISLLINQELKPNYSDLTNIKLVSLGFLGSNKVSRIRNCFTLRKNLKKFFRQEKVDLVVLFLEYSYVVFFDRYSKIKCPVVVTFRGSEIQNIVDNETNILSFFVKKGISKCNKIISLKEYPQPYSGKTVVIPNGVDSKVFRPLKNIKQKKNVILFTGRFIDIKGIHEILAVAKQLPQYEFWFAGQGPLAGLINLPNTKNLGFKTTEELVKLYNQATICVLPSYSEGFSNVGLEVTSCGRTLICTPSFSEYIENGKDGIIIPAKNEKALKDAIIDLMTNEKKREMLEKNAQKKALKYSWNKIARQYLKVFEEVIKENEK